MKIFIRKPFRHQTSSFSHSRDLLLNSANHHLVLRPAGKNYIERGCAGGIPYFAVASQIKFIPHFRKGCVSDCAHAWWEVSRSQGVLPTPWMAVQGHELWDHVMPKGKKVIRECCYEVKMIGGVPQ